MNMIETGFLLVTLFSLVIAIILFFIIQARRQNSDTRSMGKLKEAAVFLHIAGLILLTISLIIRVIATGHGPFSNMYEFTLAFTWGILVAGLFFWRRYHLVTANMILIMIAVILQVVALQLPSRYTELVPALQQSLLLTSHVAAAVLAYGSFSVGFVTALLYIWRCTRKLPDAIHLEMLDNINYLSVKIGFPFMTLVIVLGAIWADVAWGSYWNWDPKETASLVTWLIYAGYLHTRLLHKWRGFRSAILLVIGFCAVLFTFFGNYVFQGLHSYL